MIYRVFKVTFRIVASYNPYKLGNRNDFCIIVKAEAAYLTFYEIHHEVNYMVNLIGIFGSRFLRNVAERIDDIVHADVHSVDNETIDR